jgi:hypothetical protein
MSSDSSSLEEDLIIAERTPPTPGYL